MTNEGADDSTSSVPDTSERTHGLRLAVVIALMTDSSTATSAAQIDSCTVAPICAPIAWATGMRRR